MCALSTARCDPPRGGRGGADRAAARIRPHADDRRRAARRLSLGRRRFERRRGDDGGAARPSRSAPSRSPSEPRAGTNPPMPPRSPGATGPIITSERSIPIPSTCSTGWRRSMTSRSPTARRSRPSGSARWRARTSRWRCRVTAATRCSPAIAAIAGIASRSGCAAWCRRACADRCSARPARSIRNSTGRRARCAPRRRCEELARDAVEAYFSSVSICSAELRRRLFSSGLRARAAGLRCR